MSNLAEQALEMLCAEFDKEERKDQVKKHILDPCVKYMGKQLWPYVFFHIILLFCLLVVIIYLLFVLKRRNDIKLD